MEFMLSDRPLRVEIERRKGTRHLRMRLGHENELRVSVPWHCPERFIRDFIGSRHDWILEQLDRAPAPLKVSEFLIRQGWVSIHGRPYVIDLSRVPGSRTCGYLRVEAADRIVINWGQLCGEDAFLQLTRKLAKGAILDRVFDHTRRLDLLPPRVAVRDQSSRWGSCAATGNLSLNWRLILLPPELMDYVILHELAHLKEFNHSARFWALLDRYDPNRAAHEAALDAVSPEIMRVGRSS